MQNPDEITDSENITQTDSYLDVDSITESEAICETPLTTEKPLPVSIKNQKISEIAKSNRQEKILLYKETNSRDPRNFEFPENIFVFLNGPPIYHKYLPKVIDDNEITKRRNILLDSIAVGKRYFPFACDQLKQWVEGTGKTRIITKNEINLTKDLEIRSHFNAGDSHIDKLRNGIKRERKETNSRDYNVLYYQNSTSLVSEIGLILKLAKNDTKALDLFFGLGGFTVASEIVYHGSISNITIDQWRFQIFDKYDWDIDEKHQNPGEVEKYLFIFLPQEVINQYDFTTDYSDYINQCNPLPGYENMMLLYLDVAFFIEMEISLKPDINNPHWYDVFSEIVDAKDWISDFR